ncbi:MAG: response regulator transcription factor [Planctomycetota bacterium]|jgi:DNA-binding NarL/FixJ family response regulator
MKTSHFKTIKIAGGTKTQANNEDKTRIMIAGGRPLLRHKLAQIVRDQGNMGSCLEAETAYQALEAVRKQEADLAIIDISLKDTDGIGLSDKIKLQSSKLSVLILSIGDEALPVGYNSHGINGGDFLKNKATKQIIKAIRFAVSLLESNIRGFSILVKVGGQTQ